ncbi:hypothetical protein [Nesterenkonia pannonica]|uniref:hypothetical protein n=1 Tax=Nesterenkonia pannonica TaxID=1548602 RepID=UPI002164159E|nr:hypothetical protein [Nesterenkonia pannonica]
MSSLSAADQVILVGAPDPVGFSRLVRSLGDYAEAVPDGVAPKVVINQLRGEVVGRSPQRRIAEAWARYGEGRSVRPPSRPTCPMTAQPATLPCATARCWPNAPSIRSFAGPSQLWSASLFRVVVAGV